MSSGLEIKSFLHEKGLLKKFIELPYSIYQGDILWVAPFRDSLWKTFSEGHPFFREGGKEQRFLAFRGKTVVARAAAIVNPRLKEGAPPVGLIGFFEAENDQEAANAVFDAACEWLADSGMKVARGPVDRDTWHRYRVMTKGFREQPILGEPYNKDWYPRLFEQAGFTVAAAYYSTVNRRMEPVMERHMKGLTFAKKKGYTFRPIDMKRFDDELDTFFRLSTVGFSGNFCYGHISLEEFKDIYRPAKRLVDPNLIMFACDPKGKEVGLIFGTPELSHALAAMGGSKGMWGKLQFWLATRSPTHTMNYKSVAILPEARRKGLASALTCKLYEAGIAGGYTICRHCLMKMDNLSRRLDEGHGVNYKEYALYERRLTRKEAESADG